MSSNGSFIDRTRRTVDRRQQRHRPLAFLVGVVKKFGEDRAGQLAALIAYYSFFSIFPLMLVLVTVLGFALGDNSELRADIADSAVAQIPVIGAQIEGESLEGSAFGLVIGLAVAAWAGTAAMVAAQNAMNEVWNVEIHDRPNFVAARLRAFAMLLVLGLALIGTTALGAVGGSAGDLHEVGRFGLYAANIVLNVLIVGLAFVVLTDRKLRPTDLWPGALLAGIGYFVLQTIGTQFIARRIEGASDTYGTFATVIGLLTYFYVLAQLTVFAAEVNNVRAEKYYPRSLDADVLTDADRRVLTAQARAAKRSDAIEVRVTDDTPDQSQ